MEFYSDNTKRNYNISERYIFYKDQMEVTNVIDIEISYREYQNIKGILVIDQNLPISALKSKIPETLDKLQKFTCLTYPKITNLVIKRDKDKEIPLKLDSKDLIENVIRIGDVLLFDLYFKELWIDVTLSNEEKNRDNSLNFEIKVNLDSSLLNLICIIVNLSFKFFALNINNYTEEFSLFSSFQINIEDENGKQETLVSFDKDNNLFSNIVSLYKENDINKFLSKENISLLVNQQDENTIFSPINEKKIKPILNYTQMILNKPLRQVLNIYSHLICKASFLNLNTLINDYLKSNNNKVFKSNIIGNFINSSLLSSNFESYKNIIWKDIALERINQELKDEKGVNRQRVKKESVINQSTSVTSMNYQKYLNNNISERKKNTDNKYFKLAKVNKDFQQNPRIKFLIENNYSHKEKLLSNIMSDSKRKVSNFIPKRYLDIPLSIETFIDIVNNNTCLFFSLDDLLSSDQWSLRNFKYEKRVTKSISTEPSESYNSRTFRLSDFISELIILYLIVILFLLSILIILF